MPSSKKYDELVDQAERAVKDVKDPELRRVAFEKILDALLQTPHSPAAPTRAAKAKGKKGKKEPEKKARTRRGPKGYVKELVDEGFFKKPKTTAQVKAELANRGRHIPMTSLSGPMQALCQDRVLRRQMTRSKAGGKRQTFSYSEW